jgi:plasmid stabilization system protein ParE
VAQIIVTPQAQRDVDDAIATLHLPDDAWPRVARSLTALETFPLAGAELRGRWAPTRFVLGPWSWMLLLYRYEESPIGSSSSRCTTGDRRPPLCRAELENLVPKLVPDSTELSRTPRTGFAQAGQIQLYREVPARLIIGRSKVRVLPAPWLEFSREAAGEISAGVGGPFAFVRLAAMDLPIPCPVRPR